MTAHAQQASDLICIWGISSPVPPETHQTAAEADEPKFQKLMPPEFPGFVTVSKEAFFATVGQLDVIPHIASGYDTAFGYTNEWQLRDRTVIGKSRGGTYLSETRYAVSQAFHAKHFAKEAARV